MCSEALRLTSHVAYLTNLGPLLPLPFESIFPPLINNVLELRTVSLGCLGLPWIRRAGNALAIPSALLSLLLATFHDEA